MYYSYSAYTKDGKKINGTLECASEHEAKDKIRELNLLLTALKEDRTRKGIKQFTPDGLIIFTSQLTQLISAKIPLYESLVALEEQFRGEPYHAIILSVAERVKGGSSLSSALKEYPQSFPPLYLALISAGEAVGNIELAFVRLTTLLSHQRKLKKQLMSALTYPIFLAVLMFLVVGVLFSFVIPSLEALFEGTTLPWFTTVVFSFSHIVQSYGLFILLFLVCGGLFFMKKLKEKKVKAKIQRVVLTIPLLNRFIIHSSLSRFARTLATLLDGGLPLTTAIEYAQEAVSNARIEEIITHVSEKIIEGRSISQELGRFKEIPALFLRMVRIGEESGKLSPMLLQVASMYEEETERQLSKLVNLAQPVLLLIMGVVVGTVILSILLPLSSFNLSSSM